MGQPLLMRVLVSVGGDGLFDDGSRPAGAVAPETRALTALAIDYEVVLAHGGGHRELELALRNELPDREPVTVSAGVVVTPDDGSVHSPSAIVSLGGLRTLVDAGALVICSIGFNAPIALDESGAMRYVDGVADQDLAVALLARRLDADMLLLLGDDGSTETKVAAARRFAEATDRPAVIGPAAEARALVSGSAGVQIRA